MKCLTSRKGFTLIELLIVMAIIGILAAIVIPQIKKIGSHGNSPESTERHVIIDR